MYREIYPDLSTKNFYTYFFTSVGRNGRILKAVVFTPLKEQNIYNLGMATVKYDEHGKAYLDGKDKTNNGDINLVLSTTAKTIEIFTTIYPERKIYFKGYEPHLTAIYQRAIKNDYQNIIKVYNIFGDTDPRKDYYRFVPLNPLENYYGFLLIKK